MNKVTVRIGGETINYILQGISQIERKDEDFDDCTFTAILSDREEIFEPGDNASVTIDNGSNGVSIWSFIVKEDKVELYSKNPLRFMHSIRLTEKTELLSKYPNDTLHFSGLDSSKRTLGNYCERLTKCFPLERVDLFEETRMLKFNLTEEESTTIMPEMELNYGDVLTQLKTLFSVVDAIPRWDTFDDIYLDVFNKKNNLITKNNNIISYNAAFDLLSKNNTLHSYLDTALPSIEHTIPNSSGSISTRTEEVVFSTSEASLNLDFPIEKILKVEVLAAMWRRDYEATNDASARLYKDQGKDYYGFRYVNQASLPKTDENGIFHFQSNEVTDDSNVNYAGGCWFYLSRDVTDLVLLEEEWQTLDVAGSTDEAKSRTTSYKENTLYYRVGDNKICGLGAATNFKQFLETQTLYTGVNMVYRSGVVESSEIVRDRSPNPSTLVHYSPIEPNLMQITFRVTYIPQIDPHVKISRSSDEYDMLTNQSSGKTDLKRYGLSLKNLLNRLGHADKNLIRLNKNYNEVNHVGDYLADGYILTAVQHIVYNDYVLSLETYNKRFNRTMSYTGIDQSTRAFAVSATACYRNMNYTEHIIVSFEKEKYNGKSNLLTQAGINRFFSSFENVQYEFPIQGAVIKTRDRDGKVLGDAENGIYLPIVTSEFGNSMIFYFSLQDKVSCGIRKTNTSKNNQSYQKMDPVIYTDDNGEFYSLEFSFVSVKPKFEFEDVDKLPESRFGLYFHSWNDYKSVSSPDEAYFDNFILPKFYRLPNGTFYEYNFVDLKTGTMTATNLFEAFFAVNPIDLMQDITFRSDVCNQPDQLPRLSLLGTNYETMVRTGEDKALIVCKDALEIPTLTYQLQITSDNPEELIIGDSMVGNNHLIKAQTPRLFLWASLDKYDLTDTKKCKGEILGDLTEYFLIDGSVLTRKPNSIAQLASPYCSVAIGDEEGNLIIAINNISTSDAGFLIIPNIYFYFLNKLPESL